MADPTIKKIDAHPNLVGVAAIDDKVLGIDASQLDPAQKTVLISMNQLSIHTSSQLEADVVESLQIKDAAVTATKIDADAVDGTKIADDSIDSEHYVDGSIDTAHLSDNCVTEAKLGTIKRTVVIKLNGSNDTVIAENNANLLAWAVSLNNFIVIDARINLATASSSGAVTVALTNQGGTMATLSLAAGATGMSATGTISTSYRTAITNNFLSANVTEAGTGAKGLSITLVLQGVPA